MSLSPPVSPLIVPTNSLTFDPMEGDYLTAALYATARQKGREAAAARAGVTLDQFLRLTNDWPTTEGDLGADGVQLTKRQIMDRKIEADHTRAAWKATANQRWVLAQAAEQGYTESEYLRMNDMWPISHRIGHGEEMSFSRKTKLV